MEGVAVKRSIRRPHRVRPRIERDQLVCGPPGEPHSQPTTPNAQHRSNCPTKTIAVLLTRRLCRHSSSPEPAECDGALGSTITDAPPRSVVVPNASPPLRAEHRTRTAPTASPAARRHPSHSRTLNRRRVSPASFSLLTEAFAPLASCRVADNEGSSAPGVLAQRKCPHILGSFRAARQGAAGHSRR